MPSYRYLKDIKPEDLQQEPPAKLSKKDRRKNWWHYHKVWVIAAVAVLALAGMMVYDAVTQVRPDLSIAVVTPSTWPEQLVAKVEEGLAELVGDLNGDGQAVVQLNIYTIEADAEQADAVDPNMQMAGIVKLSGDIQTGETMLFILDGTYADAYQAAYGILGLPNGSLPPESATAQELGVALGTLEVFRQMDLLLDGYDGAAVDGLQLIEGYIIGIRPYYGTAIEGKSGMLDSWTLAGELLQQMAGGA